MAISDAARKEVDFTAPYYTTPGRFVIRKDSLLAGATPAALAERTIAVAADTAHEAFLEDSFPARRSRPSPPRRRRARR